MTFNLLQLPLIGGSRRRARWAVQTIERADPDIVVLNEAFNAPARWLVTRLRATGYHATPHLGTHRGQWTSTSGRRGAASGLLGGGVYVLSRYPIMELHQHVYRAYRQRTADAWSAKGVALVALDTPDGRVWLAGTHLQADTRSNWHEVRLAQLAELRGLVSARVPVAEPVLLAGDLNIEYYTADAAGRPGSPGTDHRDAQHTVGGRLEPDGAMHHFTFDGTANPLIGSAFSQYRNVLDYVGQLGDAPRVTIRTETVGYEQGHVASDHFPVLAAITWPTAPANDEPARTTAWTGQPGDPERTPPAGRTH